MRGAWARGGGSTTTRVTREEEGGADRWARLVSGEKREEAAVVANSSWAGVGRKMRREGEEGEEGVSGWTRRN